MIQSKKLRVSVIIPVYNEEGQLLACLEAISRQTVKPFEVIVVDNNSTDDTASIAGRFGFIKLLREPKQGVVHARNRGFDAARGDIIARIDADTLVPSDWLETIQSTYVKAGTPRLFAATAPSDFRNFPNFFWRLMHRLTYFWPSRLLLGHTTLVGSNMFITRQTWQSVREDTCTRNDLHEDMDLALHIGRSGTPIFFQSNPGASVLARKMLIRSVSYPLMMLRVRFVSH